MVQVIMNNGVGGHHNQENSPNGKAPPAAGGLAKMINNGINSSSKIPSSVIANGSKMALRKLTKNEKRRQKNKQKKLEAVEGALAEKSMAEANGVTLNGSWPPPALKTENETNSNVQV